MLVLELFPMDGRKQRLRKPDLGLEPQMVYAFWKDGSHSEGCRSKARAQPAEG